MLHRITASYRAATLCFMLLAWHGVGATTTTTGGYQALAQHPQWLALLHMRKGSLTGRYHSEVDVQDFFLSGKDNDSEAELVATIAALRMPAVDAGSAWCRFPARAHFLSEKLSLQPPENLYCPELDYWRNRFSADEIVLVYPDPYLKNVASIFGHTFLRIDSHDKKTHPVLLSQTVSYYADVGSADNNTAIYITKGLTGHFPGMIELAPYFEKLRKYSDSEDRDIREYRLTLPPEKVREFVDHVWEVRDNSFNYFFLDENCSYRLIAMLDVVTPTHRLRENFVSHTMPVDTVKVLRENGLVADSRYIPSARKRFYEQLSALDAQQKKQFLALLRNKATYDAIADLSVLALAENYNGIQIQSDPEKSTLHNLQVSKLIRRQYESGTVVDGKPSRLVAPDPMTEGHDMARLQSGWLHDDGKDYLLLGTRFAYHDLYDPLPAYQKGVQLDVLDFQFRIDPQHESDHASIDSIRWFSLQSYSPSDIFFREPSWGFSVARQRELVDEKNRLVNMVEGYRGMAGYCGPLLCHAELLGSVLTGNALDKGWSTRAGLRTGLLYQDSRWSWSTDIAQQYYVTNNSDSLSSFSTETGYRISRDWSAYASYLHQENDETHRDRFTLSLRAFF